MIPYRIFIAAILTLVIILNKISLNKPQRLRLNSLVAKMTMGTVYFLAAFYWILSIFCFSTKWYAYLISIIIAFVTFVYYYFVYLYDGKKKENVAYNYADYIGRIGKVTSKIENGYIGKFDDAKELVFINSTDTLEIGEDFQISEIKEGKIMAIKYNLNNKNNE